MCGAPLTIYGAGNSLSSSVFGLYEKGAGSGFTGGGLAAAFGGAEGGAFPGYRSCVAFVAGGGGAGLGGELIELPKTTPAGAPGGGNLPLGAVIELPNTTPAGAPGGGNLPLGALNGGNLPLGAPGGGDFAIDALGDGNFGIGRGHGSIGVSPNSGGLASPCRRS